nr:hypothetical protein [Tanacetum cinerariifolium]
MGYKHLNTTPKTESDEIIKFGVKKLVPIPNECEVTSEDKNDSDVHNHYEIFSDSNNDDISSDDDAFEDIEYVEASPLDLEIISLEEENVEEEEFNLEDIQDVILREKLLSINSLITNIESLNDNPTSDRERLISVVKNDIYDDSSIDPILEEVDLFFASDNSITPGIGNIDYDSEGDIYFLEELLVDDFFPENESNDFDHQDDPLFPRPPPEQPDVVFFFDSKPDEIAEKISDKLNIDECFDPGREMDICANVEDDDYFPFIFVIRIFLPYLIYPEVFPLLLSFGIEDTIFDPGFTPQ